jgi:hypothetical protein
MVQRSKGGSEAMLHKARTVINKNADTRKPKSHNVVYTERIHPVRSCTKTEKYCLQWHNVHDLCKQVAQAAKEINMLLNPPLRNKLRRGMNNWLQSGLQYNKCIS